VAASKRATEPRCQVAVPGRPVFGHWSEERGLGRDSRGACGRKTGSSPEPGLNQPRQQLPPSHALASCTQVTSTLPPQLRGLGPMPPHPVELSVAPLQAQHRPMPSCTPPLHLREYSSGQTPPHFLVAATARQVSDWAQLSNQNTQTLRRAFPRRHRTSIPALHFPKAGPTIEDMRRLHASRISLISIPISDMIDRGAGTEWYATPGS
jgi:hypothetical protein